MSAAFERISQWLDRTSFPAVEDPEAEAQKIAVFRVATGLILAWRCALMLRDSLHYFEPVAFAGGHWPLHALASGAQLALAIGLALGVAPAGCAVLLLATHPAYSIWTGTYNLGPMLLAPMLGALAVLDTGRLSLLARRRPAPPAALHRAVCVVLFCAYAGWNFQALLYHLRDAYWVGGNTPAVLFTSSYLSEFHGFFRALESAAPRAYAAGSAVVVIAQSLFQFGMIPLMATAWGALFVRWWGWAFILGSLADLQLSILPMVEVLFWAIIFVPGRWFVRGADPARQRLPALPGRGRTGAAVLFCGGYGLLLLIFFANAIAVFSTGRSFPGWVTNRVLYYSGLVAPNVFNREDLGMGDRWAVLERLDGPQPEIVPFTGPHGERLGYHRGDLLYFGNSIRWRRGMLDVGDLAAYHRPGGDGHAYARAVAAYDHRRRGGQGPGRYRVTLYRNRGSDASLGADPARYRPEVVLEFGLEVGKK